MDKLGYQNNLLPSNFLSQIRETGQCRGRIFPGDWRKPEFAKEGIVARTPWQPSIRVPVVSLLWTVSFTAAICTGLTQLSERGKADNNGSVVKMNHTSTDLASRRTQFTHYVLDNWSVKCYFQGFRRSTRRSNPVLEAPQRHKSTAQFTLVQAPDWVRLFMAPILPNWSTYSLIIHW